MATKSTSPITVGPFRISFPAIFEEDKQGKFSAKFLIEKANAQQMAELVKVRKMLFDAANLNWGTDRAKWPARFQRLEFKTNVSPDGMDGWPIRDGDMVKWDGYAGCYFITAKSAKFQPGVVDARLQAIIDPRDLQAGMLCKVSVNSYAFSASGNVGLNLGLNAIQVVRDDGVRFGGSSVRPEDAFMVEADDPMSADDPANYSDMSTGTDDF